MHPGGVVKGLMTPHLFLCPISPLVFLIAAELINLFTEAVQMGENNLISQLTGDTHLFFKKFRRRL